MKPSKYVTYNKQWTGGQQTAQAGAKTDRKSSQSKNFEFSQEIIDIRSTGNKSK